MPESSHRVTIVVAVIGVIGTLGAAIIGNWDKLFPPDVRPYESVVPASPPVPTPSVKSPVDTETKPPPVRTEPSASINNWDKSVPPPPVLDIRGVWLDSNYRSNSSHITQEGDSFRFTRRGVLPNGVAFESSGSGTMTGQRFTSNYNAKYQSGDTSVGDCSGTVSPDGMRMELQCMDSLLGAFPGTAIRQ